MFTTQGSSVMRNKINDGTDLHKPCICPISTTEDKVEKWQRQAAKATNFGFQVD